MLGSEDWGDLYHPRGHHFEQRRHPHAFSDSGVHPNQSINSILRPHSAVSFEHSFALFSKPGDEALSMRRAVEVQDCVGSGNAGAVDRSHVQVQQPESDCVFVQRRGIRLGLDNQLFKQPLESIVLISLSVHSEFVG